MNISPISFMQNVQKVANVQTNPIKYKKELQKDTISFCGNSNRATLFEASQSAMELHKLTKDFPQVAANYLANLPKEELLDALLGRKDECHGTALRIADDKQFSLYIEAAKNAGCLEDIAFFETDKVLYLYFGRNHEVEGAERKDFDKQYFLPLCLKDEGIQKIFDIADRPLREKMLQTAEFTSVSPCGYTEGENRYYGVPGITCITQAKYKDSQPLVERHPGFVCRVLAKKQAQAQQTLSRSKKSQEIAQAKETLDEISAYIKEVLFENKAALNAIFEQNKEAEFAGLIQPSDMKEIVEQGDLKNISSSKLCYLLLAKIEDDEIREQFLSKETKFGVPVSQRVWQEKFKNEVNRLFTPENKKGANSLIYNQNFEKTMQDLNSLFDDEHISELKKVLIEKNAQINTKEHRRYDSWGDPCGWEYTGEQYSLADLFKGKIGNDAKKQKEFESLIGKIICDSKTTILEADALLSKFESCLSSSALEEYRSIINSKA